MKEPAMERTIASPETGTGRGVTGGNAWRGILAAVSSSLATVWQRIRAGFWSARTNLSSDFAKPLDIERISAHLAVVKRAEEEGGRDLPPSGEEVPAGTQREIIGHFTNLRRRARQQVAATAEKLNEILEQVQQSDSLARLRDVPAGCENKILRLVADFETQLQNTVEREQKQKRHYNAFREKHGLERVAYYPRVLPFYYLVVPILIVVIAFALARMIEINAGGKPGVSLAWIATVSALAVIVPFILGDLWLRSMNHVRDFNKVFGVIGIIVAIAMILGVSFYTDFHIAAVLANPDASIPDVIATILAAPLDVVSSVANWKGFGLIALTGLFSLLLAYRSDDPYPGYGPAQRSYYRARNARDNAVARLRKRINSLIDEADAEIDAIVKGFKNQARTYTRLVEKTKHHPSALNDYDAELEDACNMVLDRYRVANTAVRQSDAPMSFTEHVCFNPEGEMDSRQYAHHDSHVAVLQTTIEELDNEAKLARQNLRALNLRMINSIAESQSVDDD
jgi:hypothetical protein